MRSITHVGVTLALTVALIAPAAGADVAPCDDGDGNLVFDSHQAWVTDDGTRVGNLSATPARDFPTWHDEAPTASYEDGAGAGYLSTRASDFVVTQQEPFSSLTLEGTFTGCLDTIAIELYFIDPTDGLFAGRHTIRPQLLIDDIPFHLHSDAGGVEIEVEGDTQEDTALVGRFAFTEIHQIMELERMDPEAEHTIRISVTPQFANSGNVIYVYDAVEVPTNLHFNGSTDGFTEFASQ